MSEFAGIDFAHPLTTETFDRTPEMRAERTGYLNSALEEGISLGSASVYANQQMFRKFGEDVTGLIDAEYRRIISGEIATDGPSFDDETAKFVARHLIRRQLKVLHESLPYPGLERIAEAAR